MASKVRDVSCEAALAAWPDCGREMARRRSARLYRGLAQLQASGRTQRLALRLLRSDKFQERWQRAPGCISQPPSRRAMASVHSAQWRSGARAYDCGLARLWRGRRSQLSCRTAGCGANSPAGIASFCAGRFRQAIRAFLSLGAERAYSLRVQGRELMLSPAVASVPSSSPVMPAASAGHLLAEGMPPLCDEGVRDAESHSAVLASGTGSAAAAAGPLQGCVCAGRARPAWGSPTRVGMLCSGWRLRR